jgi:hypothetical protein
MCSSKETYGYHGIALSCIPHLGRAGRSVSRLGLIRNSTGSAPHVRNVKNGLAFRRRNCGGWLWYQLIANASTSSCSKAYRF